MADRWAVGPDEAVAIIMPYWQEIVERFEESGYDEPGTINSFILTDEVHDNCRHFAATRMDGKVVYVAPDLVHMPSETIIGILAHEAGHVVDLQCPGFYWYRQGKLMVADELPSKGLRKVIKAWNDRGDDEVERVADEIAYKAVGIRIGYVGSPGCLVQALGRGVERPKGLR